MKRARGVAGITAATLLVVAAMAGAARAAGVPKVEDHGSVIGRLAAGEDVTVRVSITHPDGWQKVQRVVVALRLRGRRLDEIVFRTSELSIVVEGDGSPVVVGQAGELRGPFFRVDTARVGLTARGDRLTLTVPVALEAAPPTGARLFYNFTGFALSPPGFTALTPPVQEKGGFSWGTLAVAVAAALFLGGFVGNLFASSRRRKQGPSVYAVVQHRIRDQERAGP